MHSHFLKQSPRKYIAYCDSWMPGAIIQLNSCHSQWKTFWCNSLLVQHIATNFTCHDSTAVMTYKILYQTLQYCFCNAKQVNHQILRENHLSEWSPRLPERQYSWISGIVYRTIPGLTLYHIHIIYIKSWCIFLPFFSHHICFISCLFYKKYSSNWGT